MDKSYLSSWLAWDSSLLEESFDTFSARVMKDIDERKGTKKPFENRNIRWTVWPSPGWGIIKDIKRQDSCVQKDWAILKSNQLPAELSFAVIGHKGWDKDIFTDNWESSDTLDCPNNKALGRFTKKHSSKVQYLIVISPDRFSRNLAEALLKIEDLPKKTRSRF